MLRIVFAGTPEFAERQLQALLNTSHPVVAVYTQPDKPAGRGQKLHQSPVKRLAQAHHIPVEQPMSLKTPEAVSQLRQYQPDVMIVAAYGLLLPKAILACPRYGCINVHASLLPRWRGASPIQQAILAGDDSTGITLMQMNEGLDTGDILISDSLHIEKQDTASTLHDKLALLGAELLSRHIDEIAIQTPIPQDPHLATHAGKITKEQAHVNWSSSAIEIDRQIRAFNSWPVAYALIGDQIVRIWQAKILPQSTLQTPGTIIEHSQDGIVIATGNQETLLLQQGQLPGKKPMPFSEILKGHHALFEVGTRLI